MTPEKFNWSSPEGEKEIARRGEQRVAHERWAAQELLKNIGDGADEGNFFEGVTPPMPDVYGLENPDREVSVLSMASGSIQTTEFPMPAVAAAISANPNDAGPVLVVINSLNR